ncbi:NADP-dependent oxidoreductase [Sphingobium algorifonticola]|uniref:NADP-dependent oxidoreductase n=1 Tax=Sphingobium algorifonticola TaxID=2008318 RepID=A0A437J8I8_9SPHN|nr:NADP-dependent oxidoreductase [Sphingobium algorifonticola]RVT41816.1 NADP-dependent oxidoreductase [Sphingobium algorifonticola]
MARAWCLTSRPEGLPTAAHFALRDMPERSLEEGEIRVRNRWLSVDPYMRGRMNAGKSYVEPFGIDAPMTGGAAGEVTESRHPGFAVGDKVLHMGGWRDEAIVDKALTPVKLPDSDVPLESFLHAMGLTGATAWIGLLKVAQAQAGDRVFVSAAAGAVGSIAVQIAKAKGMTVIGSAGGAEKCAWVKALGADAVIDYRAGPVLDQLRQATRDIDGRIDVYFDNVGGDHLDAALACSTKDARFAICGMIGGYNDANPLALHFSRMIIVNRIRIAGFLYSDHLADLPAFQADMGAMLKSGDVTPRHTIFDGLEQAPDAFLGLFSGANMGKMLIKL